MRNPGNTIKYTIIIDASGITADPQVDFNKYGISSNWIIGVSSGYGDGYGYILGDFFRHPKEDTSPLHIGYDTFRGRMPKIGIVNPWEHLDENKYYCEIDKQMITKNAVISVKMHGVATERDGVPTIDNLNCDISLQ